MDWKEFLRPNVWKIIIPIVIILGFSLSMLGVSPGLFLLFPFVNPYVGLPLVDLGGIFFYIGIWPIFWYFLSSALVVQKNRNLKLLVLAIMLLIMAINILSFIYALSDWRFRVYSPRPGLI
jgi:hypothetical protein